MPHKVAVTFQAEMKSFVESDSSRVNSTVSHLHVSHCPGGAGEEYSQKNWAGLCGPLPKAFTLFKTKIWIFPTLFIT